MRVQPHLPSSPFTATVIESSGVARCACRAANSPAPPEPRMRMSVVSEFTAFEPLNRHHERDEREADGIEERLWIHEHEACDDEHDALDNRSAFQEPSLESARERDDADR